MPGDGLTRLKIKVEGEQRVTFHTSEKTDDGEMWLVTYELRDGKSVEVGRVNARNVQF